MQHSKWSDNDLELVSCDFCGGTECDDKIVRRDGLKVVQCRKCHLTFINPRPKVDVVSRLYDQDYFAKGTSSDPARTGIGYDSYSTPEGYQQLMRETQVRFDILTQDVQLAGKRLLEVGCATGEFCGMAANAGAQVLGVDLSPQAIELARKRFPGLKFEAGALEDLRQGQSFDVICAFEVIEHVISPRKFFEVLRDRLKPGGFLALSTPNCDCARHVGWSHWRGFQRSFEHLHYFGAEELNRYGREYGMTPVSWHTWGGYEADNTKTSHLRSVARSVLSSLHLIQFARRARSNVVSDRIPFQREGCQNDLVMVFALSS